MSYWKLRSGGVDRVLSGLVEAQREAERLRDLERRAAVHLQRVWRGYIARKYMRFVHLQAQRIQCVWRGAAGRRRVRELRLRRARLIEELYFAERATLIQKVFRGYLSRRDKQDYYKRQSYIKNTLVASQQLAQSVSAVVAEQNAFLEEQRMEQDAQTFSQLTEGAHHLVSTKTIPGVYASRYGEQYAATAYGIPMDMHLDEAFRNRQARRKQTGKHWSLREPLVEQARTQKELAKVTPRVVRKGAGATVIIPPKGEARNWAPSGGWPGRRGRRLKSMKSTQAVGKLRPQPPPPQPVPVAR